MTTWIVNWSTGCLSTGPDPPILGFSRHPQPQETPYSASYPLRTPQALWLLPRPPLVPAGLRPPPHHPSSTYLLKCSWALDLPQHCIDCVRETEWIIRLRGHMVRFQEWPSFSQQPFNEAAQKMAAAYGITPHSHVTKWYGKVDCKYGKVEPGCK